jgi:CDP-2,3-bis-(O-geranylgeranyl)-sn-glycerol synthase
MEIFTAVRALVMIGVASTVPWLVGRVLGERWAAPLDCGYSLWDGKRLFGSHKTWRGLIAGIGACTIVGAAFGLDAFVGAGIGAAALAGDALSSALKRRLQFPPGSEVLGVDQLPEALLPLVIFSGPLGLELWEGPVLAAVFTILDILATPLRHRRR